MEISDQDRQRLFQRHVEEDTAVLSASLLLADGVPMLLERWCADGIYGSTIVLLPEHVGALEDAELQNLVSAKTGLDLSGPVTICRRPTHIFVNFNFESE